MDANPLQTVIDKQGLLPLAKAIGVSYQAIRKWQATTIPAERVIQICETVGYEVTPHQLRPDLYPNPTDALSKKAA